MPKAAHVPVAAAIFFLGFTVWLLSGWSQGLALRVIDNTVLLALSAVAVVFSAQAAVAARGRLRAAWAALTLALLAWGLGQLIWTVDDVILHQWPFPSAADVFFLLFPVCVCVALLLFRGPPSARTPGLVVLDGLVVAAALFIASWLLVLETVYRQGAASTLEFVLLLAYPVSDLVLVIVATMVLVGADSGHRLDLSLLTVGLTFMAVAHSGYAYLSALNRYFIGHWLDTGWVAALLLMTVAADAGRRHGRGDKVVSDGPGWASVWLPYAPVLMTGVVLAAKPPNVTVSRPVLIAGPLLFLAVLTRQFLAVRENRRLVAGMAEQALHDPLTGLANRALFADRLKHALQLHRRDGRAVAVMVLDIDDFKSINDTLGHAAGDEVLKRVSQRITQQVSPGDTVARLGGDEFAVMLEGGSHVDTIIAGRLVRASEEPLRVEGGEVTVRLSVGLTVAGDETDLSAEELLRRADLAMYDAKRARAAQVNGGSSSPARGSAEALAPPKREFTLGELRDAVGNSALAVVYQPKYDTRTGALVGVEALLRWPHPTCGLLTPAYFLPLVRRHGLMREVTDFVVNTALDDAQRWHAAGAELPVAVNFFPVSLAVTEMPSWLSNALSARGLSASFFTVEITEDMILSDLASTRKVLNQLRDSGMRVAIDDFGSGFSALSYLGSLAIDEIKLDRAFVAPINHDARAASVVRAVIALSHELGLITVAEGVEDAATLELLREFGCDVVQGFYLSAPMSVDDLLGLVAGGIPATGLPESAATRSS